MPNYDLGTAHGQIIIDYDNKGSAKAQRDFTALGKTVDGLGGHFTSLGRIITDVGRNWGSISQAIAKGVSFLAGSAAVITGITLAAKGLDTGLLGLKGGILTLAALRTVIGGVPKSISGFPNVLKQIVLLSSAITLLGGGLKILDQLSTRFSRLSKATPVLRDLQKNLQLVAKPTKDIANLILTIGTFILATKAVLRASLALAKLTAVIGGLVGSIHIIGLLVVAIQQLSGVAGLLPAAFAAAAVTAGTLALGLHGLGQAFKDSGDPKKLAEDLKGLAPPARQFVRQVLAMKSAFKGLQLDVQSALFKNLADEVKPMAQIYLPILHKWLVAISSALNSYATDLTEWFGWPEVANDVSVTLGNIHAAVVNLEPAWIAVLHIMDDIVTVGSGFLPQLATYIGRAATAMATFVDNARASGQLAGWIQGGINAFRTLGQLLGNIFSIIGTVFGAFNAAGGGLLSTLTLLTGKVVTFLHSAQGSQALKALADILGAIAKVAGNVLLVALQQLGPIIVAMLPSIKEFVGAFGSTFIAALKIIGPILLDMAKALGVIAPFIAPFAGALFTLGVVTLGVGAAFGVVKDILIVFGTAIKVLRGIIIGFRAVVLTLQVAMALLEVDAIPLIAVIGLFAAAFLAAAAVVAVVVILIIKYWDQIKAALTVAWTFISNLAVKVWTAIVKFLEGIWKPVASFFTGIWNSIIGGLTRAWNTVNNFFGNLGKTIAHALSTAVSAVGNGIMAMVHFFEELPGRALAVLQAIPGILVNAIKFAFTTGLYWVIQGIEWIIAALIALPVRAVLYIRQFGVFLITEMIRAWQGAVNAVQQGIINMSVWITQLPDRIISWIASTYVKLVAWTIRTWDSWRNSIVNAEVAIGTWLRALPGRIINWIAKTYLDLVHWTINTWNNWRNTIVRSEAAIGTWVRGLPARFLAWVGALRARFIVWIVTVWHGWYTAMIQANVSVMNWIKALPGRILGFFKGAGRWLANAGKAILQGLLDGLLAAWHAVTSFVGGIADKIRALKGPLPYDRKLLTPAGEAIMGGLHKSMMAAMPGLLTFVKGIAPQIQDAMGKANATVGLGVTAQTTGTATMAAATTTAAGNAAAARAATLAGSAATQPQQVVKHFNISNLNVAGNLDPTNPVAYRQTIKNLRDDLRSLERSSQ